MLIAIYLLLVASAEATNPVVKAVANQIKVKEGITKTLGITCNVLTSEFMIDVISIRLYHIKDSFSDRFYLSSVSNETTARLEKDSTTASGVTGYVGSKNRLNFLTTEWEFPTKQLSGIFKCHVVGVHNHGYVVYQDEIRVEVTDTSKEELEEHVKNLTAKLEEAVDAMPVKTLDRCEDLKADLSTEEIVRVKLDESTLPVKCAVDETGLGWTVFQKRFDGAQSFDKTFVEYEEGFGDLEGEFWLGLSKIRALMKVGKKYQFRADVESFQGTSFSRVYPIFDLGPAPNYTLTVGGLDDGTLGFSFHSGLPFTAGEKSECSRDFKSGWWFREKKCFYVHLNAEHNHKIDYDERGFVLRWLEFDFNAQIPLTKTRMMFREAA